MNDITRAAMNRYNQACRVPGQPGAAGLYNTVMALARQEGLRRAEQRRVELYRGLVHLAVFAGCMILVALLA